MQKDMQIKKREREGGISRRCTRGWDPKKKDRRNAHLLPFTHRIDQTPYGATPVIVTRAVPVLKPSPRVYSKLADDSPSSMI